MRLSETARCTTAHEAAYRVQYPNSTPRLVKVIALDREASLIVEELSQKSWNRAIFFSSLSISDAPTSLSAGAPEAAAPTSARDKLNAWLGDVAGRASRLVDEIDSADIVVVIASPGSHAEAAVMIGEACRHRHKSMIGLILQSEGTSDEALSFTLHGMRPLATMLVVASGIDYVEEMLHALRA